MNRLFVWLLLASALLAGQSYRYPIQYAGGAVSHADADGYRHVPRTLGQGNGNCLLTQGRSGDAFWGSCPGASGGLDSAHVSALIGDSLDANNHGWVTATGDVDSARVAGLSDSAKALVRYARTTAVHDTADTLRKAIATKPVKHRFSISSATGVPPLTMSYDNASRVLTLTPTGASFSWWWYGLERIQSTPLSLPAHSATTGLYFASFDSLGAVTISTTPFDILRCVPIALFDRNSALGQTWVYPELHTDQITPLDHAARHTTVGALMVQGGAAISGYTLNSDALASVTYGIGSATIWDEDAKHSIAALADGGPYQVRYRTAPGVWSWVPGLSVPYRVGTTYITADVAGVQTELNGAGLGQYVNYYVVLVPTLNGPQIIMVQGQAVHSTEAAATAETWQSLDRTGLPCVEFVPVWQITYRARSVYTGVSGRVQMVRAAPVGVTSAAGSAAATTLQGAYNASPTPQIVTSVAAGPLTVQRGTASDTNAVIQVQNGAGAVVSSISGDGALRYKGGVFRDYTTDTTYTALYGSGVTPAGDNYAVASKKDGTATILNGLSSASISVYGIPTLTATETSIDIGAGMIVSQGGSTRITGGGSFRGTGAILTGALSGTTATLSGNLTLPGVTFRDDTYSSSTYAAYGSGVTPSNTNGSIYIAKDGLATSINGSSVSALLVGGATKVAANSTGAQVTGTLSSTGNLTAPSANIGSSTAMLKRVSGALTDATAGTDYVAPSALSGYLPKAAGNTESLTGMLFTTSDIAMGVGYGIVNRLSTTSYFAKFSNGVAGSPSVHFPLTGAYAYQVDGTATFAGAVNTQAVTAQGVATLSGGVDISAGAMKLRRVVVTTSTYTLPTVGVEETIQIIFDVSSCDVSTGTQSVSLRRDNGDLGSEAAGTVIGASFGKSGSRARSIFLVGLTSTIASIIN